MPDNNRANTRMPSFILVKFALHADLKWYVETVRRSLTDEWVTVALQLAPSDAEVASMVGDLFAVLSPHGTAQLIGCRLIMLKRWRVRVGAMPGTANRRLLWLCWVDVCRPGQAVTVFDRCTFGRFTLNAGPENAGAPIPRRTKQHY